MMISICCCGSKCRACCSCQWGYVP